MSTAHKLIDLGLGSHSSYSFESDAREVHHDRKKAQCVSNYDTTDHARCFPFITGGLTDR